eukprot:jgi/Ulvmu1/5667/UM024_0014.1
MATDHQKLMQVNDKLFVGLSGLATDQQTLFAQLRFRHNMYKLCEERDMRPATFAHMVSNTLYEKRFGPYFCAPVIAGIDDEGTPFLAGMDTIGAMETAKDFMVQGTAPETLYGVCESFWRPGMKPDELFQATSQALLSGVDRDALAGWGAVVYVVTKEGVTARTLKGRMD